MATPYRAAYLSDHSSGVRFVNTWHVVGDAGAGGTDPNAATVRDALHGALTAKYKACLPPTVQLQSLVVREELHPTSTDVPEESAQTINQPGTLTTTGDTLPVPTCMLATLYSNAAIRSGHGRFFLPACVAAANLTSAGLWDTTVGYWDSTTKAFFDQLIQDQNSGGILGDWTLRPVIYSRTRRAQNISTWYFDVTSYTRRTQPHWLRSRMTAP